MQLRSKLCDCRFHYVYTRQVNRFKSTNFVVKLKCKVRLGSGYLTADCVARWICSQKTLGRSFMDLHEGKLSFQSDNKQLIYSHLTKTLNNIRNQKRSLIKHDVFRPNASPDRNWLKRLKIDHSKPYRTIQTAIQCVDKQEIYLPSTTPPCCEAKGSSVPGVSGIVRNLYQNNGPLKIDGRC